MKRAAILGLGFMLSALAVSPAFADIPVPDPPAVWGRGRGPDSNTIVAAGAAISAVIVAAGLVIGRWPVKTTVGRMIVAVLAGLALLAVWGVAGGTILQAQRDRGLWKQWEIDEADRRSRWRGPDEFPPTGPPPPVASESSAAAPPPAEAESVQ